MNTNASMINHQLENSHTDFLSWFGIIRLGLIQTCIGAIVVMTTSTLNRIMVVELALPAMLPGFLVALHYLVQLIRPRMGFSSDQGKSKTPWIIGGMGVLALGGIGASIGTVLLASNLILGLAVSTFSFILIGIGVSTSGTSLLALLAKSVNDQKRAAAATLVWIMMIFGFAFTSVMIGKYLDPFTPEKIIIIAVTISIISLVITNVSLYKLESSLTPSVKIEKPTAAMNFKAVIREVWSDPDIRHFTKFIFLSMLAFSSQDLILEPFAGMVFHYTVGETTSMSGLQHTGVLVGMVFVAITGSSKLRKYVGSLNNMIVYGCMASALAMLGLAVGGIVGQSWPLKLNVFILGLANGTFSIAAIGSMMRLAVHDGLGKEGVRIGLWGGAQAIAFGLGGLIGAIGSDVARQLISDTGYSYAVVFLIESFLFVISAKLALDIKK